MVHLLYLLLYGLAEALLRILDLITDDLLLHHLEFLLVLDPLLLLFELIQINSLQSAHLFLLNLSEELVVLPILQLGHGILNLVTELLLSQLL